MRDDIESFLEVASLLQHAEEITARPAFDDHPIFKSKDIDSRKGHFPVTGRETAKRPPLDSPTCDPRDHRFMSGPVAHIARPHARIAPLGWEALADT